MRRVEGVEEEAVSAEYLRGALLWIRDENAMETYWLSRVSTHFSDYILNVGHKKYCCQTIKECWSFV